MLILPAPTINPQIVVNQELSRAVLDRLSEEYLSDERTIPHLTELIYCLTRSYDDRIDPTPPTDEEVLLFCMGFGLERILLKRFERPETRCKDGIYYSVDFISLRDVRAELKTTRTSIKRHNEEGLTQTWLEQIAGYCYAEGKLDFDLATLYLMGNYAPPFPKVIGRRLSFSIGELEANWAYLLNRQEWYMYHLQHGMRPEPYKWNKIWECIYCRYKLRCEVVAKIGPVMDLCEEEEST